jgi:hypothetical protein
MGDFLWLLQSRYLVSSSLIGSRQEDAYLDFRLADSGPPEETATLSVARAVSPSMSHKAVHFAFQDSEIPFVDSLGP